MESENGTWTTEEAAEIGRRIGAARGYRGWSQRELAKRLGVDAKTVNRYEREKSIPKEQTLIAVISLTGVRPDWFDLRFALAAKDLGRPVLDVPLPEIPEGPQQDERTSDATPKRAAG